MGFTLPRVIRRRRFDGARQRARQLQDALDWIVQDYIHRNRADARAKSHLKPGTKLSAKHDKHSPQRPRTQGELADKLNYSRPSLSLILHGQQYRCLEFYVAMANELDMALSDLIRRMEQLADENQRT